jgi:PII-like signaling protein
MYEAIVRAAREQGLAGATVLRGVEGFGAHSRIHTVKVLRLSEDLPIVVEIIDRANRVQKFLETTDRMVTEGLVTLETINVVRYRYSPTDESADDELELEVEPDETARSATAVQPSGRFVHATERARHVVAVAKEGAAQSRHVFVDSVHLLLALIAEEDGIASHVLHRLGVNVDSLKRELRDEVSRDPPTHEYLEALDSKSRAEASWLSHDYAGTEHLLLALCELRPSAATDILMRMGVQPRDVCRELLNLLGHEDDWQRWLADHPDM